MCNILSTSDYYIILLCMKNRIYIYIFRREELSVLFIKICIYTHRQNRIKSNFYIMWLKLLHFKQTNRRVIIKGSACGA